MIISVYSYKGGVGRTQLTANIASYLCFQLNKKVLLIDWDLEAPGLHFYFNFDNIEKKGVIDLFIQYCNTIEIGFDVKEKDLPIISDFINPVVENNSGKIDMITSGLYNDEYFDKINDFNWKNFYEELDGANYIELLKKQIRNLDYDFILIDSRTGVSDYSGICNVQLPDVNIIVVAPTKQNFNGALKVANSIRNSIYVKNKLREPIIFPLLSRLDLSIENQSNDWLKLFYSTFNNFLTDLKDYILIDNENEFIEKTLLDYKRDLAFGEKTLFDKAQSKINQKSLALQYKNISDYLFHIQTYSLPNKINDFSNFTVENYSRKLLCVFLLDVSASMQGKPIELLTNALKSFVVSAKNNPSLSEILEISVITFSSNVNTLISPTLISQVDMPDLSAQGGTVLFSGIREAIKVVEYRKKWYKETGQPYYRPWIFLLTDGYPTDGEFRDNDITEILEDGSKNRNFQFFVITIGDDEGVQQFRKIAPSFLQVSNLQDFKFNSLFNWVSTSLEVIINSTENEKVNLPSPSKWMQGFSI